MLSIYQSHEKWYITSHHMLFTRGALDDFEST